MKDFPSIDVVVPVYEPGHAFMKLLRMLYSRESVIRKVIVVVTRSENKALPDLQNYPGLIIHAIEPEEFDHGRSRNLGMSYSDADFVIMMTQDAVPESTDFALELLKAFDDEKVVAAYARQLAREDAKPEEFYTRAYHYPETSAVHSLSDAETLGLDAFFLSDVCAMYRRSAFYDLGCFPFPVIFNEDMIFAHKALNAGYKIAYAADAHVIHSHDQNGKSQYRRSFDMAVSHVLHPEVFGNLSAEGSGKAMMMFVIRELIKNGYLLSVPRYIYHCGMRFLGFRKGKKFKKYPEKTVLKCTMNRNFWRNYYGTDQSDRM